MRNRAEIQRMEQWRGQLTQPPFRQLHSQRLIDGERGRQGQLFVFAELVLKLLAGEAGQYGSLRHAVGAGDDTERHGDEGGVFIFMGIAHEEGDSVVPKN
jgi:hypothetical protein